MAELSNIWLIYSREHNGFWRPNRYGYTWAIEQAGRYTKQEADLICADAAVGRGQHGDDGPPEVAVIAPEAESQLAKAQAVVDAARKMRVHLSDAKLGAQDGGYAGLVHVFGRWDNELRQALSAFDQTTEQEAAPAGCLTDRSAAARGIQGAGHPNRDAPDPAGNIDALVLALKRHHQWHQEIGTLGFPDGSGGWCEVDMSLEYVDSLLCDQTIEALAAFDQTRDEKKENEDG